VVVVMLALVVAAAVMACSQHWFVPFFAAAVAAVACATTTDVAVAGSGNCGGGGGEGTCARLMAAGGAALLCCCCCSGEYLEAELSDAADVVAWIASAPWCTGAVGLSGKSWGGFNGLQIAARGLPSVKAVVSLYSTDDRYGGHTHARNAHMHTQHKRSYAQSHTRTHAHRYQTRTQTQFHRQKLSPPHQLSPLPSHAHAHTQVCGRRALHRRRGAGGADAVMGVDHVRVERAAAGPGARASRLAGQMGAPAAAMAPAAAHVPQVDLID
jgi:X-Pro dipeptidyl-peptidase (S15 family)